MVKSVFNLGNAEALQEVLSSARVLQIKVGKQNCYFFEGTVETTVHSWDLSIYLFIILWINTTNIYENSEKNESSVKFDYYRFMLF